MSTYSIHVRYRDNRELSGLFKWEGFVTADSLEGAANRIVGGNARSYTPKLGDLVFVKPTTQQNGDSGGQGLLFEIVQPPPPELRWEPR